MLTLNLTLILISKKEKNVSLARTRTPERHRAFPTRSILRHSGTHQQCRRKLYLSTEYAIMLVVRILVRQA